MKTLKELAIDADAVQHACNLSGVVHSFALAMTDLWEIAREEKQGMQFVNQHAITRVWISKLVSLSGFNESSEAQAFASLDEIVNKVEGK